MEIDLQLGKIKDLYRSYDGALMSSTIANLDVEELVYAFAGFVGGKVVAAVQQGGERKNNVGGLALGLGNLKFGMNEEDSLDNQEPIEDQIG